MGDDTLDQYRLTETEKRSKDAIKRVGDLEGREAVRDVKVAAMTAALNRNSAFTGAVVLAIVAAALGVIFGVGK